MQIFACNVKIYIWIESFFNMVSRSFFRSVYSTMIKLLHSFFITAFLCTRNGNLWFMNLVYSLLKLCGIKQANGEEILFYFSSLSVVLQKNRHFTDFLMSYVKIKCETDEKRNQWKRSGSLFSRIKIALIELKR